MVMTRKIIESAQKSFCKMASFEFEMSESLFIHENQFEPLEVSFNFTLGKLFWVFFFGCDKAKYLRGDEFFCLQI